MSINKTWMLIVAAWALGACEPPEEPDPLAHCVSGYSADPRDATPGLTAKVLVVDARDPANPEDDVRDISLPEEMVAWLDEQGWPQQHDDWHNVRRWDQGCRRSNATVEGPDGVLGTADDCANARRMADRGLSRAPIQEGAPGDGYDFLVMHRHMLEGIRQAFPSHAELLRGFKHVPRSQEDPENPMPWRRVSWSAAQLRAIEKLENIERHLDEFPTEDELALYMQVPFRWTPQNPTQFLADTSNGIHFSLHAQWSVFGSPVALGNGEGVVKHLAFWRLHGWLDDVWQRYRQAKGLRDDDPQYLQALRAQCEEMHALDERKDHEGRH